MTYYQDILETSTGSNKKGNKRNVDPTKSLDHTYSNNNDTDDLISRDDSDDGSSYCCSPIIKHKHSPASTKEHKIDQNHSCSARIMSHPVVLPCSHGYCHECVLNLTNMISNSKPIFIAI